MYLLQCSKCRDWLCPTDFHRATKTKRGYKSRCKLCSEPSINAYNHSAAGKAAQALYKSSHSAEVSAYNHLYYMTHSTEILERAATYRETNRELLNQKALAHYAANQDRLRQEAADRYHANPALMYQRWLRWARQNPDKLQALHSLYRARKRNVPIIDRVLRQIVFERDKWVCQLCHEKVNPKGKRGEGPSIDHIIPTSKGGPESYANCVLAHRRCNSKKRNRTVTQQMRLF